MLLKTHYPKLFNEIELAKNSSLDPSVLTIGSGREILWVCSRGHEWVASVKNRVKGSGCPYCSGYKAIKGETDLKFLRPEIAKEFDYSKNVLLPDELPLGSNKQIWWICSLNHSWEQQVIKRVKGYNCPYCSNKKLLVGFNDLGTTHPNLAAEFSIIKNNGVTPQKIFAGTSKKYWWICDQGHEYEAAPNKRSYYGRGCPYCSGQKRNSGINDFLTEFPNLYDQLDKKKNINIDFSFYGAGSNKKLWWICSEGHERYTSIKNKIRSLNDCPDCALSGTSGIEQSLFQYVQNIYPEAKNRASVPNNRTHRKISEIDILLHLGKDRICLEYDGNLWHESKDQVAKDTTKTIGLLEQGYVVIRIREHPLNLLNIQHENYFEIPYKYNSKLDILWIEIFKSINTIR